MKKTLLLKKGDIKDLVDMNNILRVVEEAFKEHALGRVQMPPKELSILHRG